MRPQLLASSFTALLLATAPVVVATSAFVPVAVADTANIPLNKVVGTKAVDQNNDTVGDVVGAVVSEDGSIKSLIIDVGSWISGKKDIEVQYSGVTENKDGNFVVPITQDQAKTMSSYGYSDPGLRGKLLGENGSLYQSPSTSTASATSVDATAATANASTNHDGVTNDDGSLNSSEVVGLSVENNNKDSVGKIKELLIGKTGQIQGVVVDVGGFLGMGTHRVKLGWNSVKFMQRDGSTVAVVDASKDALKAMPEYKAAM